MLALRLDSVSPSLAASFRMASPSKRRQAARIAAEAATWSAALTESEALAALDVLRAGAHGDASLRAKLEALAARLDDEYLRLDEDETSDKAQVLQFFSKARAASALAFALSDDPSQLHEAIYEAIAAMDDPKDVVRSVEDALASSG